MPPEKLTLPEIWLWKLLTSVLNM